MGGGGGGGGGSGYPDLKIYKDHSPADRVIFEGISRFCAPLESEKVFTQSVEIHNQVNYYCALQRI